MAGPHARRGGDQYPSDRHPLRLTAPLKDSGIQSTDDRERWSGSDDIDVVSALFIEAGLVPPRHHCTLKSEAPPNIPRLRWHIKGTSPASPAIIETVIPAQVERFARHGKKAGFGLWLRPRPQGPIETLGTGYGRWRLPLDELGEGSVCYCAGVGEDTQFDEALMARGHKVLAFDPTPRAIAHAEQVRQQWPQYRFSAVGLWDENTAVDFFVPKDPRHVSHSILNLQNTTDSFHAKVCTLETLMSENGHESIDLLKIDIEGAEHRVIADILRQGIYPRVICLEFDQPSKIRPIFATSKLLKQEGYVPVDRDGWNVTWQRIRPN